MSVLAPAVEEHAPAKINLALHVVGRRADGYHLLDTLVAFTRLGDTVVAAAAAADSFAVAGPFADAVPAGGDNLVLRARDLLRRGGAAGPVSLHLSKTLPAASGIGGGSSDAAATLRAVNRLKRLGLPLDRLARIGAELGADVPMCVMARPLTARGIGERLEPRPDFPELALVLVNPGVALPTPAVFSRLAQRENPPLPDLPPALDAAALCGWLKGTRNDLAAAAAALAPAIAEALAALDRAGARLARMSGSGATCYGIFSNAPAAEAAAALIRGAEPAWFVAATQTLA